MLTDDQVDLLRRELEFVTRRPDRWDQGVWLSVTDDDDDPDPDPAAGDWTCGTTACLAGWTALHLGYRPFGPSDGSGLVVPRDAAPGDARGATTVETVALVALGLTPTQADELFDERNSLRDLWEFARVFSDGRVAVPTAVAAGHTLGRFDPTAEDRYRALATDDCEDYR